MEEVTLKKNYFIDTNVLIDDPTCLTVLSNGEENNLFIPFHVLMELDKHKKDPSLKYAVVESLKNIESFEKHLAILYKDTVSKGFDRDPDHCIIEEIVEYVRKEEIENPIIVSNDRVLRLRAALLGIKAEVYSTSLPFKTPSEMFTGFITEGQSVYPNSFSWVNGIPVLRSASGSKPLSYQNNPWGIKPKNEYQNAALELLLDDKIKLVTLQSEAGYGKTFLALAAAFEMVFTQKKYKKIYCVKPCIEIGNSLGFLPGDLDEKMAPYVRNIMDLIEKLGGQKQHLFVEKTDGDKKGGEYNIGNPEKVLNKRKVEILPIQFVRGMNIDDAVVIIDELQNLSRREVRAMLTRMGENVKVICLGDTKQVDNPHLNEFNNGMNWVVKLLLGEDQYAHLVLKGNRSRGPITDMVLRKKL